MDAEKDKPVLEKSPSSVDRDNTKTENDNDNKNDNNDSHPEKSQDKSNDESVPEKPNDNQDLAEKHGDNDKRNDEPHPEKPDDDKDLSEKHDDDKNNDDSHPEKPDGDQDLTEKHGDDSPSAPKPSSDAVESEIRDEEQQLEESPPLPLTLDLAKVSEEVDQYISTFCTAKDDGDESITPPDVPIVVEQFVILVESKIADYDSTDSPVRWSRLTEEDSSSFLEAVLRLSSLSKVLSEFSSESKYACCINRIGSVLQRAMSYLEEEFKLLLEDYKIHDSDHSNSKQSNSNQESEQDPSLEPAQEEVVEEDNYFPGYSEEIVSDLIRLSKTMMAGGHETECCQIYFLARRNALEDSLIKLGFEKNSIDDVQKMQWELLEREIMTWIRTFKECASVHFSNERKLSDAVFSDHPSISESLFCSLSHGLTIQLLNFSEAVALTKRAAEKLFKFLDVYEALRDILPTMENLFPEEWMNEVKTESSIIKGRLGEAIISIFSELENSIKADSGKTPVPGGAIHPLTRYTMNYLKLACEYTETLEQVFRQHQKIERADSATGSDFNYNSQAQNPQNNEVKQSPFHTQMIKVMDLLDANLESKSKLYKDHALSSIFMMNNGRYMLQKIKGSNEIHSLMGDSWYRKRSSELRQYHKGYQRETWGKLLSCLHPEGLMVHGKVVKPVLKERFKSFNAMFDEIHKTQSTWVVSDEQLQSELRVSISNMVIPAYRSFLGRFSQVFTPGRQTEKYVKYQAEDIETYIDELFDGSAAPMGRKKP